MRRHVAAHGPEQGAHRQHLRPGAGVLDDGGREDEGAERLGRHRSGLECADRALEGHGRQRRRQERRSAIAADPAGIAGFVRDHLQAVLQNLGALLGGGAVVGAKGREGGAGIPGRRQEHGKGAEEHAIVGRQRLGLSRSVVGRKEDQADPQEARQHKAKCLREIAIECHVGRVVAKVDGIDEFPLVVQFVCARVAGRQDTAIVADGLHEEPVRVILRQAAAGGAA
mmetsp:Transcript_10829/g.31035  ORF Transcript_10829/g.31035 Transcript_10829/m.31035 type:complete len:226 (-) Transcript_10829:428-1105(-)